jgi:hypothetical protein
MRCSEGIEALKILEKGEVKAQACAWLHQLSGGAA